MGFANSKKKAMDKNKKVFMWYKVNELWKKGLNKSQIRQELGWCWGQMGIIDQIINSPLDLLQSLSAKGEGTGLAGSRAANA